MQCQSKPKTHTLSHLENWVAPPLLQPNAEPAKTTASSGVGRRAPNKRFVPAMFHLRTLARFHKSYVKGGASECWPWLKRHTTTWGRFRIWRRPYSAARVAYYIHHRIDPAENCVCHTCDNPICVNPAHLFLGTHADNMRDKMQKGRHVSSAGEKHGMHKLNEDQVRLIRKSTGSQRAIAKQFGISQRQVFSILHNQSWKHLSP